MTGNMVTVKRHMTTTGTISSVSGTLKKTKKVGRITANGHNRKKKRVLFCSRFFPLNSVHFDTIEGVNFFMIISTF